MLPGKQTRKHLSKKGGIGLSEVISLNIKRTCLELAASGKTRKQIYKEYFSKQFDEPQSYESFARSMCRWRQKLYPDDTTLVKGTYEGFYAHDATVQVNSDGEIVQAWIKQKPEDLDVERFMDGVRASVEPYGFLPVEHEGNEMLEIPLFDMHWGVVFLDYYKNTLDEILGIINERKWEKIVILFGQDFFHNDSIEHGITSNGTPIEKVDMERAVKDGRRFMYAIIDSAIQNGSNVHVIYTPGNHDRSISWMFIQVLLERYGPQVVDDTFAYRKILSYGQNAIMVTHGDSKISTAKNLAHIFPISFPQEFGNATIREVHSGHLHHEGEEDVFGVMVRRLSSGVKIDKYSDQHGFVGSHKRFMLFRWTESKLKAIYYV